MTIAVSICGSKAGAAAQSFNLLQDTRAFDTNPPVITLKAIPVSATVIFTAGVSGCECVCMRESAGAVQ